MKFCNKRWNKCSKSASLFAEPLCPSAVMPAGFPRLGVPMPPANPNAQALRRASRAERLARAAALRAPAPAPPAPLAPPIRFADAAAREAAAVPVIQRAMGVASPDAGRLGSRRTVTYEGAGTEAGHAARAAYESEVAWGPEVRVAARVPDGAGGWKAVVLVGPLSAVRQAAPDEATIEAWREAGVCLYPMPDDPTPDGVTHSRYVPLDEAPRALQLEHEARGLAAEASPPYRVRRPMP